MGQTNDKAIEILQRVQAPSGTLPQSAAFKSSSKPANTAVIAVNSAVYRGKCSTPYFREEEISQKLGEILKNIHVPDEVVHRNPLTESSSQGCYSYASQEASEG